MNPSPTQSLVWACVLAQFLPYIADEDLPTCFAGRPWTRRPTMTHLLFSKRKREFDLLPTQATNRQRWDVRGRYIPPEDIPTEPFNGSMKKSTRKYSDGVFDERKGKYVKGRRAGGTWRKPKKFDGIDLSGDAVVGVLHTKSEATNVKVCCHSCGDVFERGVLAWEWVNLFDERLRGAAVLQSGAATYTCIECFPRPRPFAADNDPSHPWVRSQVVTVSAFRAPTPWTMPAKSVGINKRGAEMFDHYEIMARRLEQWKDSRIELSTPNKILGASWEYPLPEFCPADLPEQKMKNLYPPKSIIKGSQWKCKSNCIPPGTSGLVESVRGGGFTRADVAWSCGKMKLSDAYIAGVHDRLVFNREYSQIVAYRGLNRRRLILAVSDARRRIHITNCKSCVLYNPNDTVNIYCTCEWCGQAGDAVGLHLMQGRAHSFAKVRNRQDDIEPDELQVLEQVYSLGASASVQCETQKVNA